MMPWGVCKSVYAAHACALVGAWACMCACMRVRAYEYIRECVHAGACKCVQVPENMCVRACACVPRMCACVHTCMRAYVHA